MPVWDPKANDLLSQALDCASAEKRGLFLDQACGADTELRARVEKMLAAQAEAGSFLESPASNDSLTTDQSPLTEGPGTVIGPYKLLQQIGEGGMGVVFMAEQTEPLQRTVALKIIKPGMDTRQVIARFEAERQAVAMMDHPNIAKVLDAGTTDSGRPYFVMELVKGVPITKYCDEKHLPLPARLELFTQVCQAVQHAHQKGIIHRDIKPNNVLVAEYDNRAVPKVIDFGVAKATAQKLTERTMFTEFGQVLGTMEYMSPEQSKFNQLDIDTRSDIYSLGVLLYELLAGSTPFEGKRLHAAAFDEMLRIIREEEPPKPSTRLSSIDTLPSVAVNRHTEPARLSKDVQGELDWIVMKALEKDRNRRYETASGFAADIERHLHDEPVEAGPPSAAYRFRKFARRNKAALITASVVAAALFLGLIATTWQAIRATTAEALAQARLESEKRLRTEADESRRDAEHQGELASHERDRAQRHLHAAQLNLAAAAAARGDLAETMRILDSQQSEGNQDASSRGFGWRYLWALCHEGHQRTLRGNRGPVRSVKFVKDLLVSGSTDGSVHLSDTVTGKVRSTLAPATGAIRGLAVSPDGNIIAAGSSDGTVSLWNATTGTIITSSRRHQRAVDCVDFSPNGKLIASSDQLSQELLQVVGETVICETVTGREVARYPEPGNSVAFSPDGRTLAVTQSFAGVKLLDVSTGQIGLNLRHRMRVLDAAFSPDGKTIASGGSNGEVKLWDVATGEVRTSLRGGSANPVHCITFSADGTRLACGRHGGMVDLWELTGSHRVRTRVHGSSIRSVAFSPDGASVASGSDDGTISLWDATLPPEAITPDGHTSMVWSLTFSKDGSTLASTSDDHTVKLWEVATGQVRSTLKGHTANVIQAAFSPDERMLASGSDDGTVRLWDLVTGQTLAVLGGGTEGALAVAFSPDGKSLASAGNGTTIRIWDVVAKSQRTTLSVQPDFIWSVAYSGDGKMLASAAMQDGVRIWDPNSGDLLRSIPQASYFAKFSADYRTLETRGVRGSNVLLWDLGTDTPRVALAEGMAGGIGRNTAFSPDGSTLVLSRSDGIREIDVATGEERVLLPGPPGHCWAIAYSPDGRTVASGHWDGQVRFWRAASEQEVIEQGMRENN